MNATELKEILTRTVTTRSEKVSLHPLLTMTAARTIDPIIGSGKREAIKMELGCQFTAVTVCHSGGNEMAHAQKLMIEHIYNAFYGQIKQYAAEALSSLQWGDTEAAATLLNEILKLTE